MRGIRQELEFSQILELAVGNGIWAVLFVFLLFYVLKDSTKREEKYISLIDDLSTKLGVVKKISTELSVVSGNVLEIKRLAFSRQGGVNEF